MNIIEEFHQKEIDYQESEEDKETMLCMERELAWYVNNVLRKEEWYDVEWIDCRVMICEVCVELMCESTGQDFSKADGLYISAMDPPTIIMKQMFGPSLFLHECYHHYQFLKGKEFWEQEEARPRLYREIEREARRAVTELCKNHERKLEDHIAEKCEIIWEEKKRMKRKKKLR